MRLAAVKLQGFRCYENETQINIDSDLTAFIGKNDVGKSAIFDALQIFFDEKGIDQEDLNKTAFKNGNFTVSITCVFEGLPEQIVIDSDYGAAAFMNSALLEQRDPNGDIIGWLRAIGEIVDPS